jgi:hypothetical protein
VCLQETHFTNQKVHVLRTYQAFYKNRAIRERASGGVAIYVKDDILCTKISLETTLEAIAVSLYLPTQKLTVCNVYLPPNATITVLELSMLIEQLPRPYLHSSDHYPIKLHLHGLRHAPDSQRQPRWNMQYADFQKFAEEVDKQLPLLNEEEDIDNILNRFNNMILEAAHKHVRKVGYLSPQTSYRTLVERKVRRNSSTVQKNFPQNEEKPYN